MRKKKALLQTKGNLWISCSCCLYEHFQGEGGGGGVGGLITSKWDTVT